MLFAFSGIQTGITPAVVTQGTPGLDFADALSGTCTTNGAGYIYDTTTSGNYKVGANLFCWINVKLTPGFSGGRIGAASLVQQGSTIATGFAHGNGTGPQVVFTKPTQVQLDAAENHAQGIAADGAGNLYVVDSTTDSVLVVAPNGATSTVPSATLASPSAVAVDGAGNVYIADNGNAAILKETLTSGTPPAAAYTESIVPTTLSLAAPAGLTVDGSGNVYISDSNNNVVLKETLTGASYTETQVTPTTLTYPLGLAVDGNGVVYIADTGARIILKETPSGASYIETALGAALSLPGGVAVDGGGNVFISDFGNSNVLMESLSAGTYTQTVLIHNVAGTQPRGVAVDGIGDVFYVNGKILRLTMSTPPVLSSFPSTQVGSTSAAQTVGIQNVGTAPLTFSVPGSGSNPVLDADFSVTGSGGINCPVVSSSGSAGTLAAGMACVYSVEFSPSTTGNPLSSSLAIIDNSLNAVNAEQIVALSGIGLAGPDVTSTTVTAAPAAIDEGQSAIIVVVVAGTTHSSTIPTGTVTVEDGATVLATAAALTNGVYTISDVPSGISLHTLSASYTPSDSTLFVSSAGSGSLSVGIAGATTATLAVSSAGNPATTVVAGTVVKLTASVLAAATPVTTGVVNFCDATAPECTDTHLYGTAQLTSAGTASIQLTPGIGVYSYKAVFAGSNRDLTATSNVSPLTVTGTTISGPYATTTSIAQSGSGGAYSLLATVTGSGSMTLPVTGTISFLDASHGNALLGTHALGASKLGLNFGNSASPSGGNAAVAIGDFNGDGMLDMAVTNATNARLYIYLGEGNGSFTAGQVIPIGNASSSVVIGDFNGDGRLDLATANYGDNTVTVLLGNGDGTFAAVAARPVTGGGPGAIVTGDFNGDGNADLAIANSSNNTLTILLGNGDGTFNAASSPSTGNRPQSIAVGDFNHDGKLDLGVANLNDNTVSILLGNGDGTFTAVSSTPSTGNKPGFIVSGDFNGDGKADLAAVNQNDNTITILLGNGDGSFTHAAVSPITGNTPLSLTVADFNHDGKDDLAVVDQNDNTVTILLGNGDGTFIAAASPSTGSANSLPQGIAVGDFNGDGFPDLAVTNSNAATTAVLLLHPELSTEMATATVNNIAIVGSGTHSLDASYPGDSNYDSSLSTLAGVTAQPVSTVLSMAAMPVSSTYGQQVTLTAMLSPYTASGSSSDGETITVSNGVTTIGTGTVASGVAIIHVTALQAGAATLTASYAGDTNLAASTSAGLSYTIAQATPTITFNVAGQTFGSQPIIVSATSPSSAAFTYAVVTGPATVTGATATITGVGTVVLSATQAANGGYAAGSQNATFHVAAGIPLLVFAPIPSQNIDSLPFSVIATSPSAGVISYAVVSGPATIAGSTVTQTGAGVVTLSASQAAAGNYTASTVTTSFTVVPGFTINPASGNDTATIQPGGAATYNLSLTPASGSNFPDAITFTATGMPAGASATFSPQTILSGSGPTNITVIIQTDRSQAFTLGNQFPFKPITPFVLALLLPLLGTKRVRRRFRLLQCSSIALLVLLAAAGALSGCGGPSHTSPQTYTLVITATDMTISAHHSTSLQLTVD